MDRYPGYESMLARVEQKKVQVKGQRPTFYSHLVNNMVAFVLDQVNECCNVATVDATTDTTEDHLFADGPVTRALDTRSDLNEQTNSANPQVDHQHEGSISNEPTGSPPSVIQSTIPTNIEVKVEDVSDGQSIQLREFVKKEEEDGGEYVMECDCEECEICRVKREMKEELDESGETEQMEGCVKQEIKEELEDGEMMHIKEEEEEDGEVEGQRPNKIQRMDRVLGNVPVGSLSPSTNGIPINVEYIDDQVATSSAHQIEDHTQTSQPVTIPLSTPIVKPSSSTQHVNEAIRDELLNAEPMMDNVGLEDPSTGDAQVPVPAENLVKRIELDEFGNRFECDYLACGKRMKKRLDLIAHIRTHTGEMPFKCSFEGCDRAFVQNNQLKRHLNTHSGTRPFVCTWPRCDARFGNKSNLTVHIRTHTGERPFECDQCDATFTQHTHLVTHLRTHTGSRPFVCTWPDCGQAFTTSSNLKKHSSVHSNECLFVCNVPGCTKVYKQKVDLRRHQETKHI